MITQPEVYRLFGELDRLPGIMEPRLQRWRAWPIAKMQLVWALMEPPEVNASRAVSLLDRIGLRLSRYPRQLTAALRQTHTVRANTNGVIGVYQVPRIHRFFDGEPRDMVYGDLLTGAGMSLPLVVLQRSWDDAARQIPGAVVDVDWHQSLAEILAIALMRTPRIYSVADQVAAIAAPRIPLPPAVVSYKIRLALSLFEARRRIFGKLLRRLRARGLLVTYSPGRSGEIAAARETGIPVAELQHGMVSAHCPDYAWPQSYASLKPQMPVPDRIAMFGHEFRRQIMQSGFWSERDILVAGAAAIDLYRPVVAAHVRRPGKKRLLFMTQSTIRPTALAFWNAFSKIAATSAYEVMIKVHLEEAAQFAQYRALAKCASDRFTLLPIDANPIEAMLDSDVVVAYNSLSLIEGIGLGRPVISLCGGSIPSGFVGLFKTNNLRSVMPHVVHPEELVSLLVERVDRESALEQWRMQSAACGAEYFASGFSASITRLINDMIASPDTVQTCFLT